MNHIRPLGNGLYGLYKDRLSKRPFAISRRIQGLTNAALRHTIKRARFVDPLTVDCPVCRVEKGQFCKTKYGGPRSYFHMYRRREARKEAHTTFAPEKLP